MNAVDELNFLLGIGPPRPHLPITLQRSGYTAVRTLGKGSFGQALLVFHKGRQSYYVVKHVNMANMNARQRKDAHNEISVLQQLHHPNVVRYEDCFEEPPHLYIVMEYADGGDVFSHLAKVRRRRPLRSPVVSFGEVKGAGGGDWLTEAQVISLFVQTTMAVKYMHDRRLLHRDIKSQNVFLTKQHVVKLGDFGIAMVLQNTVAMASTMCGTPCYFSPELCLGKPYNNKSDVWALGVLLYELCAGHVPFESTTMKSLMREIVNKEPPRIPPSFSDELWSLIQSMLQKDPKKRPDAGQVLSTPVLMRHVPDIIAQLEQAQSLVAAATASESGAVSQAPAPGSGLSRHAGREPVNAPYYELLQQHPQPSQPVGRAVDGVSRHGGAPSPSAARYEGGASGVELPQADDEEAYLAAYRRRLQDQRQQLQRPQEPPAPSDAQRSEGKHAVVGAKAKAPTLSPQLRAVLSKGKEDGDGRVTSPPSPPQRGAERPRVSGAGGAPARVAQAVPSATRPPSGAAAACGGRPSIAALLERFDQEKKRIQDTKQDKGVCQPAPQTRQAPVRKNQPDAATHRRTDAELDAPHKTPTPSDVAGQGGARTGPGDKASSSTADAAKPSGAAAHKPQPALPHATPGSLNAPSAPTNAQATSAEVQTVTADHKNTDETRTGRGGGDLDQMMKEMHAYFHNYQQRKSSGRSSAPTATAASGASAAASSSAALAAHASPSLRPAVPTTSPTSEEGVSRDPVFDDPAGACLDVADIQKQHDHFRQQQRSHNNSVSPSTRASRMPSRTASGRADPHGASEPLTAQSASLTLRDGQPDSPQDAFLSSLNRKYQHVASVNPMARANPPILTPSAQETPSPPLNRFLTGSAVTTGTQSTADPSHTSPSSSALDAVAHSTRQQGTEKQHTDDVETKKATAARVQDAGSPPTSTSSPACIEDAPSSPTSDSIGAAFDIPFRGQCLCGAVQLNGWFSTIYGSFVCNCQACCRLSGSTLGVEWLHVPNATSMSDMLHAREKEAASVITDVAAAPRAGASTSASGSGAMAVTVLQQQPVTHSSASSSLALAHTATRSYRFEMLVDADDAESGVEDCDRADSEPLHSSRGPQYVASFFSHFCSCCGATIGLQHDGLDGVLLPKTILDEESEAVLRRFARTVAPGADGDDDE